MRIVKAVMWMCALGLGACAAAPEERSSAPPPRDTPPAAAVPAASLVGTRWTGVVEGADSRTLPRLEFATQGRVVGFTGCNMLSGAWSTAGGEIRLGPMVTTKRACMGPAGEIEQRLMAVLGEGNRVTREGGKLVVTGRSGARFEFVEAAAG